MKKLLVLFILLSGDLNIKSEQNKDENAPIEKKMLKTIMNLTPKEYDEVISFLIKAQIGRQEFKNYIKKITISEKQSERLSVDAREVINELTIALLQKEIELIRKSLSTDLIQKNLDDLTKVFLNDLKKYKKRYSSNKSGKLGYIQKNR